MTIKKQLKEKVERKEEMGNALSTNKELLAKHVEGILYLDNANNSTIFKTVDKKELELYFDNDIMKYVKNYMPNKDCCWMFVDNSTNVEYK
jgi:hypothetical protein